jgi:hypothetical protein
VIYFNSQYLADKFNINPAKWKRWSREFLPPDPLGGLRSGYARQFSHGEAFSVFMAGFLVSSLKFTVQEVRRILKDLEPWLKERGFFGLPNRSNGNETPPFHHIVIYQFAGGRFGYAIVPASQPGLMPGALHPDMEQSAEWIGVPQPNTPEDGPHCARLLAIDDLYRFFLGRLGG